MSYVFGTDRMNCREVPSTSTFSRVVVTLDAGTSPLDELDELVEEVDEEDVVEPLEDELPPLLLSPLLDPDVVASLVEHARSRRSPPSEMTTIGKARMKSL